MLSTVLKLTMTSLNFFFEVSSYIVGVSGTFSILVFYIGFLSCILSYFCPLIFSNILRSDFSNTKTIKYRILN